MLLGFAPMVMVKIKVKVVHLLTANIWEMLIDKANITIAIEYDVPYSRFRLRTKIWPWSITMLDGGNRSYRYRLNNS